MQLDRATLPAVVTEQLPPHTDLIREVGDHLDRDLVGALREAGLVREELQQNGEPRPGRAGLVRDHGTVLHAQRPLVLELVRVPALAHPHQPLPSAAPNHTTAASYAPSHRANLNHHAPQQHPPRPPRAAFLPCGSQQLAY